MHCLKTLRQLIIFLVALSPAFIPFSTHLSALSLPTYIEDAVVILEDPITISGETKYIVHGTGFIIQDTIKNTVLLVTNRHVLRNRDSIYVRFNTLDGQSKRKRTLLKRKDGSFLGVVYPDSTIDLAVITAPKDLKFRAIDVGRFKPISEVKLGDEVYFIGFPLMEYVGKDRNYPIIRHGVVSYISREDVFSITNPDSIIFSKNMILIDATSMSGNSGSPVISTPKKGSDKASVIGVVQGHFESSETGSNLNLGIVIPVDRILEIIDKF